MKEYFESLLPFRWLIVAMLILITGMLIAIGCELPTSGNVDYFKYPIVWYLGNILWWFAVDFIAGLGRVGILAELTQ